MNSSANQNSPAPVRLLIVEEALHSVKGHWFEYIKTITDACHEAGDEVTIAAHRDADPRILVELPARPLIPYSAWDKTYDSSSPLKRYYGVFQHNRRLFNTLDELLKTEKEPFDCILAPTLLIHHLMAWVKIARKYHGKKFKRLVLFFVNGQGSYQGPGQPAHFSRHPKTALFRHYLRQLKPLVESGEVVLAAETEEMAREYTAFCGIPFRCFPHVVRFPATANPPYTSVKPTFACFGFARYEKGSDLLQEAIRQIRRRRPDLPLRFAIQWLDDFQLPDGTTVSPHPELLADPDVEFITSTLDTTSYLQHLRETDGMILPYRASSYYARVSRVAIEGAIMGIPMVYTRDTWLEEMVALCAAGEGFTNESLEGLIEAILRLADNLPLHKSTAVDRSDLARDLYSPEQFRTCLLSDAIWTEHARLLAHA